MLSEKISQKINEQHYKPGLYLVSTPIGNIFDISFRAIYILKKSEAIFAEDTRESRKLLNFYEISNKLVACHEYNEVDFSVTSKITSDKIFSLISDAGTPCISDPGYRIVNWCLENDINVYAVPGASSLLAGLCISGFSSSSFSFFGFLPNKPARRREKLLELKSLRTTLIFLESPGRLIDFLKDSLEILGDRNCVVARELTKIFEESIKGSLSSVLSYFNDGVKGEIVVIIDGAPLKKVDAKAIFSELREVLKKSSLKDAVVQVSQKYNLSKNEVYAWALEIKNEK